MYNGLKAEVEQRRTSSSSAAGRRARAEHDALVEGMRIVGVDFRDGILFVAGGAARRECNEGRDGDPAAAPRRTGVEPIGKIVIGTVKGDIDDIGKAWSA